MRCPACQLESPAEARFCMHCATRLPGGAAPGAPLRPQRAYTPRHLAELILKQRSDMVGERKQVTVLFADVKGSLALAHEVDPEDWHGLLDRFFQILTNGVHRFEGIVNQYTGDGIMALFGAPIAHEDHAQRACLAALHLRDELRRYADELRVRRGLNFSTRMGLNSGEVVVARIGDDARMDYTAQGHVVGLAQRMETLAEPGTVFVTAEVGRLVRGLFELRDLGEHQVPGVSQPIGVRELVSVGSLRTRLDVSRARGFSPFVGRGREMDSLERALGEALAGRACAIGLSAEAGVGKSRLCYEFLERCRSRGIRVHEAHSVPYSRNMPYLPALQFLRSYFGIEERDDDETVRNKVAGRAVRLSQHVGDALPLILDFLGVADPDAPAPPLDPETRETRIFEVMRTLMQARSQRDPAVFLFEDLHWIDTGSERFLQNLVEALPGTRTLLLVNHRPEYRPPWRDVPHYRELSLVPLQPREVDELVADLLGDHASVAGLPALITARTGGNPFFIEELVKSWSEDGSLTGSPGAYRCVAPIREASVPDTVQALLAARIDRLPETDKRVLQTAAVIGKKFSEPLLRAVTALPDLELFTALRRLLEAELVYEESLAPELEYTFKHRLTQEVAYRSQLQDVRRDRHARVARALERLDPERHGERAARIAQHFEGAEEPLQAAHWHRRAALWAGVSLPAAALRHWQKALALVQREPDAEQTPALGVEAATRLLLLALRTGMSETEAASVFEQGRALGERAADRRLLGGLVYRYGATRGTQGALDEALAHNDEATAIARETGDAGLIRATRIGSAHWLHYLGRLDEALAIEQAALAEVPADLDTGSEFLGYRPFIHMNVLYGATLTHVGRLADAARALDTGLSLAQQHGEIEIPGWARAFRAMLAYSIGDPDAAWIDARAAYENAETIGSAFSRVHAYQALAYARRLRGEFAEAIEETERGLAIAREGNTVLFMEAELLACLAEACLGTGDVGRAAETAHEALRVSRMRGLRVGEGMAQLTLGRVLLAGQNSLEAAGVALKEAQQLAEATGARTERPFISLARADHAQRSGAGDAHAQLLEQAHGQFVAIGASGHAARVAARLGGTP